MIFLGDLASPNSSTSAQLSKIVLENNKVFSGKTIICNFEGLVYDCAQIESNEPVLYNHSSILRVLDQGQGAILCLANNHTLDLPDQFELTTNLIKKEGLLYCGAGLNEKEAEKPAEFSEDDKPFTLFNVCWDFLLYNHSNPSSGIQVAELKEEKLLKRIRDYKIASPGRSIIVYSHWSLDLETLPFPVYRQFSRALIDAGANLVIGTHAHCVQGGEQYRNGYIIYGLGNFFLPDNVYAGGKLKFPTFAKIELVLEWNQKINKVVCNWFEYSDVENIPYLEYLGSEDFESSQRLASFSPYRSMSERQYIKFYKRNRRKKILIPVYRDYKQKRLNALYTMLLKNRARIAHSLAKINFIKWQN